jgi:hypothetical protein
LGIVGTVCFLFFLSDWYNGYAKLTGLPMMTEKYEDGEEKKS